MTSADIRFGATPRRRSTLRALLELERLGLVERTGELRNGQPVWGLSASARHLEESAPELLESIVHQGLVES